MLIDKTNLRYYEIEYFSYRTDKICKTTVRADSFVGAIYAFNRSDEILSIKLLTDKNELNSIYGQTVKKPDIIGLAEKIERNEKKLMILRSITLSLIYD